MHHHSKKAPARGPFLGSRAGASFSFGLSEAACSVAYRDDPQPACSRIPDSVGRSARFLGEIADACAAVVDQMPVPLEHAAARIFLRCVHDLVSPAHYLFVDRFVCLAPAVRLGQARQHQDQPDLRVGLPQLQDHLLGERVESQRAAGAKISVSGVDQFDDGASEPPGDRLDLLRRQFSVPGKTASLCYLVCHLQALNSSR